MSSRDSSYPGKPSLEDLEEKTNKFLRDSKANRKVDEKRAAEISQYISDFMNYFVSRDGIRLSDYLGSNEGATTPYQRLKGTQLYTQFCKEVKELRESFKTPEEKEQEKERARELRIDGIRKDIYRRRYGPCLWHIQYIKDGYTL